MVVYYCFFFFSSRRRHTRCSRDWSSDVCSSDLIYYLRFEEILAARRNIYGVGLESRCPGQGEKQPVDLAAIPVTALPEIFYVIYVFLLFPLLLLLSLLHLPGSIPELLYLRVDLLQLHFRRIIGRYDFRHCLLHRFAFPSKAFHPVVQLLPFFFPEFVRFFFRNTLAIT